MKDKPKILLVNPPIYDFTAYDYWLKPLGLLSVAGFCEGSADMQLFDFLDRLGAFYKDKPQFESDAFGRGKFYSEKIPKPAPFKNIPRYYRRFGLGKELFIEYLKQNAPFDFAMIQTVFTYGYPGYVEVIETIRQICPETKIILGGPYAIICSEHAKTIGADFVSNSLSQDRLFKYLDIEPNLNAMPFWEGYERIETAVMRLTTGCPFSCTYCSVPKIYGKFRALSLEAKLKELDYFASLGVKNIAFYDDALLYKSDEVIEPFLSEVIKKKLDVNFHSPNALNARFITPQLAKLMVTAGLKSFYLGYESCSEKFQRQTGGKVFSKELADAVKFLVEAGAERKNITAYQMLGHPQNEIQETQESMKLVNNLGIKIMLADFSPIPGTVDGEMCRKLIDIDEPLNHNKTAFPIMTFDNDSINRIKDMARMFNANV